jgi:glycosyltransferase involved in cell wall biosynthesis
MITVCIMSYGYAHLVAQAIESVLSQTKKPGEIIVVDDGKHDGVDKVASMYGLKAIVRGKNIGIVNNFNDILMNHVKTDKVMFLGADNWLRPDALEKMETGADITSSDICLFGQEADKFCEQVSGSDLENGYHIWKFIQGNIEECNYIHGSSLYNANLAKKFGYEPTGNKNSEEDWMLWKKMFKAGATHIHISEPLLYYRRHKMNFQQNEPSKKIKKSRTERFAIWDFLKM